MAFHSDFWVVVGTAAPVIALAAIVAGTHASEAELDDATAGRISEPDSLAASLQVLGAMLLGGTVIAQAVVFLRALLSLAGQSNAMSLGVAEGIETASIVILFFGSMMPVVSRFVIAKQVKAIGEQPAARSEGEG